MTAIEESKPIDCTAPACCSTPAVFTDWRGDMVCQHCGMIVGHEMIEHESRMYTPEDFKKRRHYAIFNSKYSTTMFQPWEINRDVPELERRAQMFRMQRINNQAIPRGYKRDRLYLENIARLLNFQKWVIEDAFRIYSAVRKCHLSIGGILQDYVFACLLAAARVNGVPCSLVDFTLAVQDSNVVDSQATRKGSLGSRRNIRRAYQKIVAILPSMHMRVKPLSLVDLLHVRAISLGITSRVERQCVAMITRARKTRASELAGKAPDSIIAATLYVCSKGELTQEMIAKACHVTEVTLRHLARKMMT